MLRVRRTNRWKRGRLSRHQALLLLDERFPYCAEGTRRTRPDGTQLPAVDVLLASLVLVDTDMPALVTFEHIEEGKTLGREYATPLATFLKELDELASKPQDQIRTIIRCWP